MWRTRTARTTPDGAGGRKVVGSEPSARGHTTLVLASTSPLSKSRSDLLVYLSDPGSRHAGGRRSTGREVTPDTEGPSSVRVSGPRHGVNPSDAVRMNRNYEKRLPYLRPNQGD